MTNHHTTELEVQLKARKRLPDILEWHGSFSAGYLMNRRIIDDIRDAGIMGIESAMPVVMQSTDKRSASEPLPSYWSIELGRGLDLDLQASEQDSKMQICSRCFQILNGGFNVKRCVPIVKSWNKTDIFMLRRPHVGRLFLFCTYRVLELAREKRWQGFRFEPIDVEHKYSTGWDGIDYLGKTWPPKEWYPKRPSEGKTAKEWLDIYNTTKDGGEWWDAWRALLDIPEETSRLAIQQFRQGDSHARARAARLLVLLAKGTNQTTSVPIDLGILRQAVDIYNQIWGKNEGLLQIGHDPANPIVRQQQAASVTSTQPPRSSANNPGGDDTTHERSLAPTHRNAIDQFAKQAMTIMRLDSNTGPDDVIKAISDEIDEYREEKPKLAPELLEKVPFALGSLWGEQIRKTAGWEWRLISNAETEGTFAVVSPDKRYSVYPATYIQRLMEEPDRDQSSILLYNMIKARNLPPANPGAYLPLW